MAHATWQFEDGTLIVKKSAVSNDDSSTTAGASDEEGTATPVSSVRREVNVGDGDIPASRLRISEGNIFQTVRTKLGEIRLLNKDGASAGLRMEGRLAFSNWVGSDSPPRT